MNLKTKQNATWSGHSPFKNLAFLWPKMSAFLNPFKMLDGIKSGSCGRNLNLSSSPCDSRTYPELRKSPACLVDFLYLVWHASPLTPWPPLTLYLSSPISVSGNIFRSHLDSSFFTSLPTISKSPIYLFICLSTCPVHISVSQSCLLESILNIVAKLFFSK